MAFSKKIVSSLLVSSSIFLSASLLADQGINLNVGDSISLKVGDGISLNVGDGISLKTGNTSTVVSSTRAIVINSNEISMALSDMSVGKIDLTINFDSGSDRIKGIAHDQISEIAKALKSSKLTGSLIEIEGHTDSDGSENYNLDLSYRRAMAVKKELTGMHDISAKRFSIQGYGEFYPVASNSNTMGKALNRRVTLVNLAAVSDTDVSVKSTTTSTTTAQKVTQVRDETDMANSNTDVSLGNMRVETQSNGSSVVNVGDSINVQSNADASSHVSVGNAVNVQSNSNGANKVSVGNMNVETTADGSSRVNIGNFLNVESNSDGSSKINLGNLFN